MKSPASICDQKLLVILHAACSEIRRFVQIGANQRIYDLADAIEFIPEMMLQGESNGCDFARDSLRAYQSKHPAGGFDYVGVLDMKDDAFRNCYPAMDSDEAVAEKVTS